MRFNLVVTYDDGEQPKTTDEAVEDLRSVFPIDFFEGNNVYKDSLSGGVKRLTFWKVL